jgi:hypothetical protein
VAWVYTFYAGGGKEMDGHYGCLGVDRVYQSTSLKSSMVTLYATIAVNGPVLFSKGVVSGPQPFLETRGSKRVGQPVDCLVIMAYLS